MTHAAFVAAWRSFGERWLFGEGIPTGSRDAYFRISDRNGSRWWDDDRFPPEIEEPRPRTKLAKRIVQASPRMFPAIPGRFAELVGWPWEQSEHLVWWQRWHADPKRLGLEPEPLLWWEDDLRKDEDWPLAV